MEGADAMIWLALYLMAGAIVALRLMWISRAAFLGDWSFCGSLMVVARVVFALLLFVLTAVFWPLAVDLIIKQDNDGPR